MERNNKSSFLSKDNTISLIDESPTLTALAPKPLDNSLAYSESETGTSQSKKPMSKEERVVEI
jgi:hypothetical protein